MKGPGGAVPLTREHVTKASQVMLPTYVVLFLVLGTGYTLLAPERIQESPVLGYADSVLPLQVWGAMFYACAGLMGTALVAGFFHWWRARAVFAYALWVGVITCSAWSVIFALSAVKGMGSSSAWVWPAFAAVACYASSRSLLSREVG